MCQGHRLHNSASKASEMNCPCVLGGKISIGAAPEIDHCVQGMIAINNRDTTGLGRTSFCWNKKIKDRAEISGEYNGTGQGTKHREESP